jgi:hypothetical protein
MKITKTGDTFLIEADDKELELLCDAMDSKENEEIERNGQAFTYRGIYSKSLEKTKEIARMFHNAFMGNSPR